MIMLPQSSRRFIVCTFISFGFSFHVGYLMYIVNPSKHAFEDFINQSYYNHYNDYLHTDAFRLIWSSIATSVNFGGIFGCLLLPLLSDRLGRKQSFYVIAVMQTTAALVTGASRWAASFELLAIGRFLSGVAAAMPIGLQPVYFSEVSPKASRGALNGLTATVAYFGALIGAVIALPTLLGSATLWPWLYWLQLFPVAVGTLAISFCPDSPKFLLSRNREKEARNSLLFFHGGHADIDAAITDIKSEIELTENQKQSKLSIWHNKPILKNIMLGILLNLGSGYSGSYAMGFFATTLLEQSGFTYNAAAVANIGVAFAVFIGTIVSIVLVDRVGRRPLVLVGCVSTAFICLVMMVTLLVGQFILTPYLIAICTYAVVFMGGVGIVQVSVYIASELVPQSVRSTAQSCAVVARYVGQASSAFIYFPLQGWIGPYSFFEFIIPLIVVAIVVYFWLPETKGKDVHEIVVASAANDKPCQQTPQTELQSTL